MTTASSLPYPRVDPFEVRATALRLGRIAEQAGQATDALRARANGLGVWWQGPAASACAAEVQAASQLAHRVGPPLRMASSLLLRFAEAVVSARSRIDRLRSDRGDMVARHGQDRDRLAAQTALVPGARHAFLEVLAEEQRHELIVFDHRHTQVLEELCELAQATGRQLGALAVEALPPGSTMHDRPANSEAGLAAALPMLFAQRLLYSRSLGWPPPAGTPASSVRAAWTLLTLDEQQRLLEADPEAMGRLGGLPSSARSIANEMVVNRVIEQLASRPQLTVVETRTLGNAQLVRQRLAALRRKSDRLTGKPLVAQLIVFEPGAYGGDGRAALAVGDVDTADNVAFLVPGLRSDISKTWHGLTVSAGRVQDLSQRRDPSRSTAVVAWMGYDAPALAAVVRDDTADRGGALLLSDLRQLAAVREVAPHLTLVGHSYGSTTVAEALRGKPAGVDDAVLIGSPGPNVDHVGDLNVPEGHVYVGANSRDPVSYFDYFGKDPSHESFGAIRFEAEDASRHPGFYSLEDHSKYFNPQTESMSNIVDVVIAKYDDVTIAPYRLERPLMRDGMLADPETFRAPYRVRDH